VRPPPLDPTSLTPDERLRELAALLARGLLRLHERRLLPGADGPTSPPEKPPESVSNCLELPGETRLSVHTG
jgi:hypothetical protein